MPHLRLRCRLRSRPAGASTSPGLRLSIPFASSSRRWDGQPPACAIRSKRIAGLGSCYWRIPSYASLARWWPNDIYLGKSPSLLTNCPPRVSVGPFRSFCRHSVHPSMSQNPVADRLVAHRDVVRHPLYAFPRFKNRVDDAFSPGSRPLNDIS
jgi:hypothetical protein